MLLINAFVCIPWYPVIPVREHSAISIIDHGISVTLLFKVIIDAAIQVRTHGYTALFHPLSSTYQL